MLLVGAGGFRVSVTPERLHLRSGLAGLPLLRLPMTEIRTAESLRVLSPG